MEEELSETNFIQRKRVTETEYVEDHRSCRVERFLRALNRSPHMQQRIKREREEKKRARIDWNILNFMQVRKISRSVSEGSYNFQNDQYSAYQMND